MQDNIGFWKENKMFGYGKKNLKGIVQEGLFVDNEHIRNPEEIKEYDPVNDLIAKTIVWTDFFVKYSEEKQEEIEERLLNYFGDPQFLVD